MSRIMIVDDEPGYCEKLQTILAWEGHELCAAFSGREAIDLGSRFRPEVLVVDWLLRNHIHGLHVAEVLRLVDHTMRTILITGFASPDLRREASRLQVVDFIEKPFGIDEIRTAVASAIDAPGATRATAPVGVFEIDGDRMIVHTNERARRMFAETLAGPEAGSLDELLGEGALPELDSLADHWAAVHPPAEKRLTWHLRSQKRRPGGSRLCAILLPDDPHRLGLHLIEMLLEYKETDFRVAWPFSGHVLVLDSDEMYRRLAVGTLEAAGACCYGAADAETAIRLFEEDKRIDVVLVSGPADDPAVAAAVGAFRIGRAKVRIVGHSVHDEHDAFARLNVPLFLTKPWRLKDLIKMLRS